MTRPLQTLDLEFDEWLSEMLNDGMDPIHYLRVLSQCRFVWDACRRRCASLCEERGLAGIASEIMTNDGGVIDKKWSASREDVSCRKKGD